MRLVLVRVEFLRVAATDGSGDVLGIIRTLFVIVAACENCKKARDRYEMAAWGGGIIAVCPFVVLGMDALRSFSRAPEPRAGLRLSC